jgi:hypothetical protein
LAINWDAVPNACEPCGSKDIHVVGVDEVRSVIVIHCDTCHSQATIPAADPSARRSSERNRLPLADGFSPESRRRR